MKNVAIKLSNISKKYSLYHEKPTLVENILLRKKKEEFFALKEIDLTVGEGESVGIVGANGSGKTTLLKIISGITAPTKGSVYTNGRVVSLIELGAGFHPELTGEENIFLNGLLVGMTKDEIRRVYKKIISFADIGKFIDAPLYTYSEGMKLRLSYSIVAHTDPDIILLDENLAVGDQNFREKSYRKIKEFIERGKTVVLVSHYLDLIRDNCKRAVWIDNAAVVGDGDTEKVIGVYKRKN